MTARCATHNAKANGAFTRVDVADGLSAEVLLHNHPFSNPQPDAGRKDFIETLNPHSLKMVTAFMEPSLALAQPGQKFQFERHGYFVADHKDHSEMHPVFNLAVGLKDN